MQGPGKYDAACSAVRLTTAAQAVVLIVVNGKLGSGFSVQTTEDMGVMLPTMLRDLANQIEADIPANGIARDRTNESGDKSGDK